MRSFTTTVLAAVALAVGLGATTGAATATDSLSTPSARTATAAAPAPESKGSFVLNKRVVYPRSTVTTDRIIGSYAFIDWFGISHFYPEKASVSITKPDGTVVSSYQVGQAAYGSEQMRVSWDGRNARDEVQPVGRYFLHLRMSNADGHAGFTRPIWLSDALLQRTTERYSISAQKARIFDPCTAEGCGSDSCGSVTNSRIFSQGWSFSAPARCTKEQQQAGQYPYAWLGWIWSPSSPWQADDTVRVSAVGRATGPGGQDVGTLGSGPVSTDTVPGQPTTSTRFYSRGTFEPMDRGPISNAITWDFIVDKATSYDLRSFEIVYRTFKPAT